MKKLVLFLVATAVVVGACAFGYVTYRTHRDERVAAEHKADCERILAPLSRKLEEIDSRISVGMKQDEMHAQVSDAAVKYSRIADNVDRIVRENPACLESASHYENAYQDFVNADSSWSECIQNYDTCDMEKDKLPEMRKQWEHASEEIKKGDRALARYRYKAP